MEGKVPHFYIKFTHKVNCGYAFVTQRSYPHVLHAQFNAFIFSVFFVDHIWFNGVDLDFDRCLA